jgi:hypothetical protein
MGVDSVGPTVILPAPDSYDAIGAHSKSKVLEGVDGS